LKRVAVCEIEQLIGVDGDELEEHLFGVFTIIARFFKKINQKTARC
jgi:hypothetical protein